MPIGTWRTSLFFVACILAIGLACNKAPDDGQITSQIQSKFSSDSGLQGKPITVQTAAGVVTLSGAVDNETERTAAARYASTVPGIKAVVNNLTTTEAASRLDRVMAKPSPEESQPASRTQPSAEKPRHSKSRRHAEERSRSVEIADNTPPPRNNQSRDDGNSSGSQGTFQLGSQVVPAPAPPPPAPKRVTVSSGTSMAIRLLDPIDSEKAQVGQTFRATLDSPLQTDGDSALPSGWDVKGHVEEVKSAGKFAGQSLLVLKLDSISIGGKSYPLDADSYRKEGSNRTTNTAKKVGGGALVGAIIGGIAGGGKGAGIGAAAGGGIGGGVQAAGKGQQIQLPSETVLSFNLTSPLTVTLPEKGPNADRPKLNVPQQ